MRNVQKEKWLMEYIQVEDIWLRIHVVENGMG
jgi:hypothetical protein